MSETGRMAELAHKRHTKIMPDSGACSAARLAIFNAALLYVDGAKNALWKIHASYALWPHDLRCEWVLRYRLHVHGLTEPAPRYNFVKKYEIEPEKVEELNKALEDWQCQYKLDKLGDWVLLLARFQLYSWSYYPEKPDGYAWSQTGSAGYGAIRPIKFVYTLEVLHEEDWAMSYELEANNVHEAMNPYRIRNSVPRIPDEEEDKTERLRRLLFTDIKEPDWNPESGESIEAARKRIEADFRKRLTIHLKLKAAQARKEGYPDKRPEHLDRDARWLIMKRVEGISCEDIGKPCPYEKDDQADEVNAAKIKMAVHRLEAVACLEP